MRETTAESRAEVERLAGAAVMEAERGLDHEPRDVGAAKVGCGIKSRSAHTDRPRFIEVKGGAEGADAVTVARNEILIALNTPDDSILAVVVGVDNGCAYAPRCPRTPFGREPDFGAAGVTRTFADLPARRPPARRNQIDARRASTAC